jgi:alpha-L-fucosidase
MKKSIVIYLVFFGLAVQNLNSQNTYEDRQKRTEWFREARFGMFIHWGLYAIPARGEWVKTKEKLSEKKYREYFDNFNPVDYDPAEWAKIAKHAGMKYVVLTAKHHDGFCLFDSKYTEYKATNTPAKRDLIKEYVEAFRAKGIKVGFYYSLIDWNHPHYPNVGNHPRKGDSEWDAKEYDFDKYIEYMHNQVRELLSNYGRIDIMWFDYSFGEYSGEKWKSTKMVNMVRELQPDILIDNRLGGNMEAEHPEIYAGDFEGPEQIIPYEIVRDEIGRPIPWESCITLNNQWGYARGENYKSGKDVIRTLVNCVSKGGNLLLNVGPDARGNIPEKSIEVLKEVGEWMKLNSESIYGCEPADYEKPQWGYYTQKDDVIYAHILEQGIGQYYLPKMKNKVKRATLLMDGSEVFLGEFWLGGDSKPFVKEDDLFFNLRANEIQHTYILPDKTNTVVKLELK